MGLCMRLSLGRSISPLPCVGRAFHLADLRLAHNLKTLDTEDILNEGLRRRALRYRAFKSTMVMIQKVAVNAKRCQPVAQ